MVTGAVVCRISLLAAIFNAALVPVAQFTELVPSKVLYNVAIGLGTILGILFLWMVLSRDVQYAVREANRELQRGKPYRLWVSPFDRAWGLFGSKMGSFLLSLVRLVALGEFLMELWLQGSSWHGLPPAPPILAFVGFFITILLTLIQLKNHYPRPR